MRKQKLLDVADDIMIKAWAPGSVLTYSRLLKKFHEFCKIFCENPYPATQKCITMFVIWRSKQVRYNVVRSTLSAIAMAHRILDIDPPPLGYRLSLVLKAIRKSSSESDGKKAGIEFDVLVSMFKCLSTSFEDRMYKALWGLSFQLLLRKSEALELRWKDLKFENSSHGRKCSVHIGKSKTDQVHRGYTLDIFCTCSGRICVICCLEQWRKISRNHTKVGNSEFKNSVVFPVRYNDLMEKVRVTLAKCGKDPGLYGTHSYRRGGATFYRDCGLQDTKVCQIGRWSYGGGSFIEYLTLGLKVALEIRDIFRAS